MRSVGAGAAKSSEPHFLAWEHGSQRTHRFRVFASQRLPPLTFWRYLPIVEKSDSTTRPGVSAEKAGCFSCWLLLLLLLFLFLWLFLFFSWG